MKQIILEGQLGKEFGEEWNLDVNSPAEALLAIMTQRPAMRKFLIDAEGIQGYEVFIDDESIDTEQELVIHNPGQGKYTFVPVVGGSKSSSLMMVLGVTLMIATGGFGTAIAAPFMASSGTAVAGAAAGSAAAAARRWRRAPPRAPPRRARGRRSARRRSRARRRGRAAAAPARRSARCA